MDTPSLWILTGVVAVLLTTFTLLLRWYSKRSIDRFFRKQNLKLPRLHERHYPQDRYGPRNDR